MKPKKIIKNHKFIGRAWEVSQFKSVAERGESAIIIVYGRRRVGKTELIEQTFAKRNILKFEGIANKSESEQRELVIQQLIRYTGDTFLAKVSVKNWIDVFECIFQYVETGKWTLFFEELQWLACYEENFINELKYYWDNYFRGNKGLLVILCGSSPSFMIKHVTHSKALYNRSQHEFLLKEFNLPEALGILGKRSKLEIMNAYLTVGGIPEYLKRLTGKTSILTSLCNESFTPKCFFLQEYERIFISSLANNPHYKAIILFLGKRHFATRDEILTHLGIKTSGYFSQVMQDLELCGFIKRYVPYNLKQNSTLARYGIYDPYLQFYSQFIEPIQTQINDGVYIKAPIQALNQDSYYKWLGFAFERFCRRYHHVIANRLGFSGVKYSSGIFFNKRANEAIPGYQIDLLFDRDDQVITICELKYYQTKVGMDIIESMERKLSYLPNTKNKTIHKVLITTMGITNPLEEHHYFDDIILLDELFDSHYW